MRSLSLIGREIRDSDGFDQPVFSDVGDRIDPVQEAAGPKREVKLVKVDRLRVEPAETRLQRTPKRRPVEAPRVRKELGGDQGFESWPVNELAENSLRPAASVKFGRIKPVDPVFDARRKSRREVVIVVLPAVAPVKPSTPLPGPGSDAADCEFTLAEPHTFGTLNRFGFAAVGHGHKVTYISATRD